MADNISLDSMSGGSVVATDDIGGVHYQIIKLAYGALDSQTLVSTSNGLPISLLAGSASIGVLGANSGVDIGDVTINNASGAAAVNIQDGGNAITVDGTVTANLSATDNAVLDQIELNQDSQTGILTTIDADTGGILTAVQIIDNAIAGNEMQVDVVAALPAGTNAIGKLAANSGVDIGDVDVLSLPALAAGTNAIGKTLPPDTDVTAHTNYIRKYYTSAGAATDGIIWSPAAGKRWHVVTMYIQTSADATITLEDDKAGGDDPIWKGEIAGKSGVVLSFTERYPMASGEDAADLTVTTTAGNVYITAVGYEI